MIPLENSIGIGGYIIAQGTVLKRFWKFKKICLRRGSIACLRSTSNYTYNYKQYNLFLNFCNNENNTIKYF